MGILSLGTEMLIANTSKLKRPFKLTLAITMHCNSRCVHCNIWQLRPQNELTIEEIREFAKANRDFKIIELTGGEPFMRSDVVEIVKAFSENMKSVYAITMPTNSLVNNDTLAARVEEILESGVKKFVVTLSLDGNREMHDRIRGVKGNYDKVINMYRKFGELKRRYSNFDFKLGYTIIGLNQGMFMQMFSDIKNDIPDLRISDFHVNVGAVSEHYYGDNTKMRDVISASSEKVLIDLDGVIGAYKREIIRNPFNTVNVGEYIYLKGLREYVRNGTNPFKIRSGEASIYTDNFGTVYPSILINKKLGSIREDGYNLEKMLERSKEVLDHDDKRHYTFCDEEVNIIGDFRKSVELLIR